jgi:hypothetical protein
MARDAVTGDRQRNRIFRASLANIIKPDISAPIRAGRSMSVRVTR